MNNPDATDTDPGEHIGWLASLVIMAVTVVTTAGLAVGVAHAFAAYPTATGAVIFALCVGHAVVVEWRRSKE